MLLPLRLVCALALIPAFSRASAAQTPSSAAIFGRLMEKRMDQLAKEPAVAARAPGKRGMALMQAAGDSALYFLDDAGLRELSGLFAETGRRAGPEVCARLYTAGSDGFPDAFANMLSRSDSILVDRWSSLMVRVTRAGILRPPIGRVASPEEITKTIQAFVAEQPVDARPRLLRGAAKTGSPSDVCLFTVTLYQQTAALPAATGGPVMRALMRGVKPKLDVAR